MATFIGSRSHQADQLDIRWDLPVLYFLYFRSLTSGVFLSLPCLTPLPLVTGLSLSSCLSLIWSFSYIFLSFCDASCLLTGRITLLEDTRISYYAERKCRDNIRS
ncbi:hypothetical protein C8Q69DRAFT_160305 [Paecilomyces variotii]|uniref:Uncharacterized protein n=1 Tax=Byssochlamys spectabilis TaxID=264951 RepID=A0A443I235_BYSSP|nr:hypothetical protein C8Q69DRAFT_160305 [Paecilomyces variotii]RWQ98116.1 hypothetical protein C8Q69DRAFT_160305 [Paecilomyces variotii]